MVNSTGDIDLEAQQPSVTPSPDDDEEREIRVFMSHMLESEATEPIQSDSRVPSPAEVDVEAQTEQLNQPQEPQPEPVGDFDENSNALWTLYEKEARAHDEALIKTWKEDMDGILIFAGLFSAALTSFIAESNETLQVDPMQEMVYYQRQSVAMLAHLSQQVASITPQVSIPTTPLPPFPTFRPSPSDVRVNVYYFMSLVFSLSAALLATLVQQWIRDYMHVFQRYGHPLKSARIRQFLYDGTEKWYMPVVAEAVPGLVHVSLFLFFLGLADSTLHFNTTVGIATVIPICVCGLLYVSCMFAPILDPQSPYQNPFSGLLWYLVQKVHGRVYMDRASGGTLACVSSNMPVGQMQLAMEETEGRKNRDVRAIRWLIDHLTEDTEIESIVLAIPGSFVTQWSRNVWEEVGAAGDGGAAPVELGDPSLQVTTRIKPDSSLLVSSPCLRHTTGVRHLPDPLLNSIRADSPQEKGACTLGTPLPLHSPIHNLPLPTSRPIASRSAVRDLCMGIGRMLETCNSRSLTLTNEDERQKRLNACLETVTWLVCCGGAELGWFGHDAIDKALRNVTKSYELPEGSYTESFILHCSCLVLLVTREKLGDGDMWEHAGKAISALARSQGPEPDDDYVEAALVNARNSDGLLDQMKHKLHVLFSAICSDLVHGQPRQQKKEQIKDILTSHAAEVYELSELGAFADQLSEVDERVRDLREELCSISRCGPLSYLPGLVNIRDPGRLDEEHTTSSQRIFCELKDPMPTPQLIGPGNLTKALSSFGSDFCAIIDRGQEEDLQALEHTFITPSFYFGPDPDPLHHAFSPGDRVERYLWRFEDLLSGRGLGISVEIFFLMVSEPRFNKFSDDESPDPHRALYVGLFKALTSDWKRSKHSLGTQHLLLGLVLDLSFAGPSLGGFFGRSPPRYLADELLVLVGNVLDGLADPYINEALRMLASGVVEEPRLPGFQDDALKVISRATRRPAAPPRTGPPSSRCGAGSPPQMVVT